MAKVRTKKDKQRARATLRTVQPREITRVKSTKSSASPQVKDLLSYEVSLIRRDLIRTTVATLIVAGLLVALYFTL